jgi:hypothetical protein
LLNLWVDWFLNRECMSFALLQLSLEL